jgi:hypothetical protein
MPLFLTRENELRVLLEAAYLAPWEDVPPQYQELLLAPLRSGKEQEWSRPNETAWLEAIGFTSPQPHR